MLWNLVLTLYEATIEAFFCGVTSCQIHASFSSIANCAEQPPGA
jgi:hypothetical protein